MLTLALKRVLILVLEHRRPVLGITASAMWDSLSSRSIYTGLKASAALPIERASIVRRRRRHLDGFLDLDVKFCEAHPLYLRVE